jgi:excisionase family DNA binding protein
MTDKAAMTTKELSAYLNVPVRTLEKWRYLGRGPAYHHVGRQVRYWPTDVKRWLQPQRRSA